MGEGGHAFLKIIGAFRETCLSEGGCVVECPHRFVRYNYETVDILNAIWRANASPQIFRLHSRLIVSRYLLHSVFNDMRIRFELNYWC